ncbi:DNA topoisomerase IV [Trichoderma cornu-damae]|uniref:DNA topoisomerase (ATP-hydrolyzing) n=1 Tax=Trichoderma cornu-damae TaxID=654480 RepID=A0A9P8QUI8_9HYPO|nr:DNA topoisomerase IV [Trichoderma cornu-damae]
MDRTAAGSAGRDDGGQSMIIRPATMPALSAGIVISRIESILESMLDCVSEGRELTIDFVVSSKSGHGPKEVHFPGRSAQEATKFARPRCSGFGDGVDQAVSLARLLCNRTMLDVDMTISTKTSHIFYQHQELFVKQRTVDELVDSLALALGVHRDDLNIVASSKGVFSGPLSIRLQDNTVVGPATRDAAKGYPDMLTCSFLQLMRFQCPQIPIFVLSDYDPDGLNIFRCYRFTPDMVTRETGAAAPAIRWLGIKSQDLLEREGHLGVPTTTSLQPPDSQSSEESAGSKASISSIECREPISALSPRDRKAAVGVLEKLQDFRDDPEIAELQRELQVMLMMSVKAEIQWLDEAGDLTEWLDFRLGQMLFY